MSLFVLLGIVLFTPTKVEVTLYAHNLEFQAKIQLVLMCCLPFSLVVFNLRDKPWKFKIQIFGKSVDFYWLIKKAKNKIEQEPKSIKLEQIKIARYITKRIKGYIKSVELSGTIGIKERADKTAVITEAINGLVLGSGLVQGIKKMRICFSPEYAMDIIDIQGKCIISVNAANIIRESIRYYLQRRK